VKEDEIGRTCSTNGGRKRHVEYWWKSQKKRPLGRPRLKWVDHIKLDLRDIGWDGIDWIDLPQGMDRLMALVNTVMNLRVS
jgi:hypothetical protein